MSDPGALMDTNDGFQYPRSTTKRPRNSTPTQRDLNDSFHSMKSTSQASSIPDQRYTRRTLYTAVIGNLPKDYRTPRSIAPFIHQVSNVEITNVLSTRSGVILIKSPDPEIAKRLQFLKQLINDQITVNLESRSSNYNTPQPRNPSFSCVITNVDHDVTMEEIQKQLTVNGHNIKKLWRIKSRASNNDTRLVRIITTSESSLDYLLSNGFHIFYKHHRVEPSHAPRPQPIQCNRCQEFHAPDACKKPPRCPRCSKEHFAQHCDPKTNDVKCANCKQDHPAFSVKCPARPQQPTNAASTAPLKCIDSPAEDDAPLASTHDVLRFVTTAILNAVPDQRARMQSIMANLARQLFNTNLVISYSGSAIHVGCRPIYHAPRSYSAAASSPSVNG